jgi:type III secretion protein T
MSEAAGFNPVILLGVAATRIATAFALTPFLAPDVVPGTVRMCLVLAMSVWALELTGWTSGQPLDGVNLAMAIAREAFIGLMVGFVFSGLIWAFLIAGNLLDQKISGGMGGESDPLAAGQSGLYGLLLSRAAFAVFAAAGGVSLFVQTLVQSFILWPLGGAGLIPRLAEASVPAASFQGLMSSGLMIAAPALVLLTLVEAAMGLLNRAAPRLNVFAISMSMKGWLAAFVVLLTIAKLLGGLQTATAIAAARTIFMLQHLAR